MHWPRRPGKTPYRNKASIPPGQRERECSVLKSLHVYKQHKALSLTTFGWMKISAFNLTWKTIFYWQLLYGLLTNLLKQPAKVMRPRAVHCFSEMFLECKTKHFKQQWNTYLFKGWDVSQFIKKIIYSLQNLQNNIITHKTKTIPLQILKVSLPAIQEWREVSTFWLWANTKLQ